MNWLLEHKLKRIGRQGNPDREFVRILEKRLRLEVGHPVWWIQWSKIATSSTLALILAGGATSVYAYTSDSVLPDTALYPIRQGLENVETAVALTPSCKTAVQIKHLKRRLHEQELMMANQKPVPKEKLIEANDTLKEALNDSSALPTSTQAEVDQAITSIEVNHENVLMKELTAASTTAEKVRIGTIVEKQLDHVRSVINTLGGNRRSHFSHLQDQKVPQLDQHGAVIK